MMSHTDSTGMPGYMLVKVDCIGAAYSFPLGPPAETNPKTAALKQR